MMKDVKKQLSNVKIYYCQIKLLIYAVILQLYFIFITFFLFFSLHFYSLLKKLTEEITKQQKNDRKVS